MEKVKALVDDYEMLLNRIEAVATPVMLLTTEKLWLLNEQWEGEGLDAYASLLQHALEELGGMKTVTRADGACADCEYAGKADGVRGGVKYRLYRV